MNLEQKVRTAVHDLANDVPFPSDLAEVARKRGRRVRRRRQTGLAATGLVLVAVAAVPFALPEAHRDQPHPAATTEAPVRRTTAAPVWGKTPLKLPGDVIVTAVTRNDVGRDGPAGKTLATGNVVLDRASGRYVALGGDYYTVWGAPKTHRGVVSGDRGLGIVRNNGRIAWAKVSYILEPQWSPDGTRLLATTLNGYSVIDAATGKVHRENTSEVMDVCPDECFFTWLPDGRRVALAQRDPDVPQNEEVADTIKKVAILDVNSGKLLTTLPVRGVPSGQDAWSPDGTKVLVRGPGLGRGGGQRIVRAADGKVLGSVPDPIAHFLPNGKVLGLSTGDDDALARLYDTGGRLLEEMTLPPSLLARQISIGTP
ncbi:hypothetical protein [Actinoplanes solisilvae]|uniref:hypothetical protein n=1 Tax=Actinoplanes solisilvae TaxID=2486853 RepID=UPI000FDC1B92|nr:hypothetical protein [Actinoplanes solisilvae]